MRHFLFLWAVLLYGAFAFPALADFSKLDWQFAAPISLPSLDEAGYVQVKLTPDVYEKSNIHDIRVISSEGKEIPFQLVVKESSQNIRSYPSVIINKSSDDAGRVLFIVDAGKGGLVHNRLSFTVSSLNFKRTVHVAAADTLLPLASSQWRVLTDKGYIFKFTDPKNYFSAQETVV